MNILHFIETLEVAGMSPEQIIFSLKNRYLHEREKTRNRVKKHREINKPVTFVTLDAQKTDKYLNINDHVTDVTQGRVTSVTSEISLEINKPVTQNGVTPSSVLLTSLLTEDNTIQGSKKVRKEVRSYTPEFENFYQLYPRNSGSKFKASTTYEKLISEGVPHEAISRGAAAYSAYATSQGTDQRYIAHAVTWLNQRRWESDYTKACQGNGRAGVRAPDRADLALAAANEALADLGVAPIER